MKAFAVSSWSARTLNALHHPSLEGRTVIITGGGRGFGWMIAEELLKAGARVTLTAHRHPRRARGRATQGRGYRRPRPLLDVAGGCNPLGRLSRHDRGDDRSFWRLRGPHQQRGAQQQRIPPPRSGDHPVLRSLSGSLPYYHGHQCHRRLPDDQGRDAPFCRAEVRQGDLDLHKPDHHVRPGTLPPMAPPRLLWR